MPEIKPPTENSEQDSKPQIDSTKLHEFMGRAVGDMGAAMSAVLVRIGDKLGLYKALAKHGPLTSSELVKRTKTHERYIREWLNNQAAGGYINYDTGSLRYSLSPEQTLALAEESSPVFLLGGFQVIAAAHKVADKTIANFRTGKGLAWGQHDAELFEGTERFFRPGYSANLISSWIPSLDRVEEKLRHGGTVADVGCGHGASTILMAQAFPKSKFCGFDYHKASIATATKKAKQAGVAGRISFKVAKSTNYPGKGYDLVTHFDCLHDMADPLGAAKHVRKTLDADGTWMIVEPFAGDNPEENHNPVGRVFYAASTVICVGVSLANKGPALGAQAGEARMRKIMMDAGFTRFRRATQTPFNIIYEVRP
jgi:2-polyprenyl-3-methyl-5-hydroxy-6-metoxy-1,4-benzoquinol methylase